MKELNRRTRVPIAEFIREGIDLVLERHAAQLPGQMGLQVKSDSAEVGVSLIRNSSARNSSSVGGIVSILDETISVPNETNS
ncbi:MAG: ribbon-helix-helix domain-containing protein [Bdellovibrionales bacterium]|nr:ribbon-helix-helix domain-containing protein [Bdellovibrionales bacterium]